MNNDRKFLIATAFITICGILMAFNMKSEAVERSEKVVVKETIDPIVADTADTVALVLDSLPFREQVYHYLTQEKNLSRNHALGLIANGDRESRWNPGIWNPSRTSVGIFQWTGPRQDKFLKEVPDYASNWKAQIDYALAEDKGPVFCSNTFRTPQQAATWWTQYWERPANTERARIKNNQFLSSYNF